MEEVKLAALPRHATVASLPRFLESRVRIADDHLQAMQSSREPALQKARNALRLRRAPRSPRGCSGDLPRRCRSLSTPHNPAHTADAKLLVTRVEDRILDRAQRPRSSVLRRASQ